MSCYETFTDLFWLYSELIPVVSMLFSPMKLSSLPSSNTFAPKAAFSSMSDSLPVLSDLTFNRTTNTGVSV